MLQNSYSVQQTLRRCQTAYYLVSGFRDFIATKTWDKLTEKTGEDGFVGELCGLAIRLDDWYEKNRFIPEDVTDGVFLYEFVEDTVAYSLASFCQANLYLPSPTSFEGMLEGFQRVYREYKANQKGTGS